jgi:hypothetical protein
VNLALPLPSGVTNQEWSSVTPFTAQLLATIDVTATAGAFDFDLISGPPGEASDAEFPIPKGFTIGARSATALTSGTAVNGTITMPFDTGLYTFSQTGSALTIFDIATSSTTKNASPEVILLPGSGSFADLTFIGTSETFVNSTAGAFYMVFWDPAGTLDAYSISQTTTRAAASAPTVSGDGTKATAVDASALPFVLTGGSLVAYGADWVKVTTGASDGGKTLLAQSIGTPAADIQLTIYDASGTKVLDQEETGGNVSAQTKATASTVYYVAFAAGAYFYPTYNTYEGVIRVE